MMSSRNPGAREAAERALVVMESCLTAMEAIGDIVDIVDQDTNTLTREQVERALDLHRRLLELADSMPILELEHRLRIRLQQGGHLPPNPPRGKSIRVRVSP